MNDSDDVGDSDLKLNELTDLSPGTSHRRRTTALPENGPTSPSTDPRAHLQESDQDDVEYCGLCKSSHDSGSCLMVRSSKNLAEYRYILLTHADDEPFEERVCFNFPYLLRITDIAFKLEAIKLIDATLAKRKHLDLIVGQPIRLVQKKPPITTTNAVASNASRPQERPAPERTTASVVHPVAGRGIQTKPVGSIGGLGVQTKPVAGHGGQTKIGDYAIPRPKTVTSNAGESSQKSFVWSVKPMAGPSKRKSPFNETSSRNKRQTMTSPGCCPVCKGTPLHLIKDCPVVAAGAKRCVCIKATGVMD
jgi:hypothetical protein